MCFLQYSSKSFLFVYKRSVLKRALSFLQALFVVWTIPGITWYQYS
ncbi:unnamed protein product, partial [Larinioides sclopetarius]